MKTFIKITMGLMALALATNLPAQRDKSYILKNTNVEELQRMAVKFAEAYRVAHERAIRKALEMGWDTLNLIRLDENGDPIYYTTHNNDAAVMTKTTTLRANLGVQGQNMVIGEWDGGVVRSTHQDFGGRVTNMDPVAFDSHPTHVAGTLIGNPPSGNDSRGMAPQALLHAYDWFNDEAEMASAAAGGLLISNHSYGVPGGWKRESYEICWPLSSWSRFTWQGGSATYNSTGDDPKFGNYDAGAAAFDNICLNAPFYLPVFSAGNADDSNPATGLFCDDEVRPDANSPYVNYNPALHPPGNATQQSTVTLDKNAKNIMTVGNLKDDGVTINESSSRGPTDDGRIKPDICGNGTDLYSADSGANNDYSYKTGTSMASPNVAGSLLLLQEAYENLNGNMGRYMRNATLKGLALHSATDLGIAGPDYTYGWGLLNASKAGTLLQQDSWSSGNSNATIIEDVITSAGQTWSYQANLDDALITVTLIYNDVALNTLVNDLDVKVIRISNGTTYWPYVLNPASPSSPATFGDNDIDNIEQVKFTNVHPTERFEIRVTVEGGLYNNAPQPFSLIIEGLDASCHANITHKTITPLSGTYTAQEEITSEADILPGREVTYRTNGRVVLKPGFRAQAQAGTGAGFFKTAAGTCN